MTAATSADTLPQPLILSLGYPAFAFRWSRNSNNLPGLPPGSLRPMWRVSCLAFGFCAHGFRDHAFSGAATKLACALRKQNDARGGNIAGGAAWLVFHGAKFRKRVPIDGFIADFYCHAAKLAVGPRLNQAA